MSTAAKRKCKHIPSCGGIECPEGGDFSMGKREWVMIALALVFAAAVCAGVFLKGSIQTGAWGLSFRTAGEPPIGNAGKAQLRELDAAYIGDSEEKVLYLTFDAGYENGVTAQILDALKAHNAPAAFFLVGPYITKNADLVRRMVAEGHTVGNHTMHHYDMSKIGDKTVFAQELSGVEEAYKSVTGKEMEKFYRPPQGIYSEENLKNAKELGYKTVFWSLAYVDWLNDNQPGHDKAMEKLIPRTHNGAVVLLHSTSKTNGEILDELLTKWEQAGYRFGRIAELFS